MTHIEVWSKPACPQCNATIRKLDTQEIPYEVKSLLDDLEKLEEFKEAGFTSAPVVTMDGVPIFAGFNPVVIEQVVKPRFEEAPVEHAEAAA